MTTRRNVLAVMMTVIMLAGTGAAWLLSRRSATPLPGESWYLIGEEGRDIGWEVAQSEQAASGQARGYNIRHTGGSAGAGVLAATHWTLNADAKQGSYTATVSLQSSSAQVREVITTIEYKAGRVRVTQFVEGLSTGGRRIPTQQTTFAVDETYIPEGRLEPTIAKVAQTRQPFLGTIVADEYKGEPRLLEVALESLGAETRPVAGQPAGLEVVERTWPGVPPDDPELRPERYYVDAQGRIQYREVIRDGQVHQRCTRTTLEKVLAQFPSAASERQRARKQGG